MNSEPLRQERPYTLKDIPRFRVTPRPLEDYERIFSFTPEFFKPNARVLDIGSGTHQEFAQGLKAKRSDIEVVSVDPSLALPTKEKDLQVLGVEYQIVEREAGTIVATDRDREKRKKETFKPVVAAIAPHLPFQDRTFDYVFDNFGAWMYFSKR